MNEGLNTIKNIIWAIAIAVALLALLVGLVFAISNRYYGERGELTLNVGGQSFQGDAVKLDQPGGAQTAGSPLKELPGTQDAGLEYVFNLTFLCDGTIAGVNDYSASYGGTASAQLWTDGGTGLPAASAAETPILYPGTGTAMSAAEAAADYQPRRLVIYLGGDGLASATEEGFVAGYTKLVQAIQAASPGTSAIICCSVASVSASYAGPDGLTPDLVAQANQWIKTVCINTGAYYADLASLLNGEDGYLMAEYAAADGRSVNSAGISRVMDYFRMHGV